MKIFYSSVKKAFLLFSFSLFLLLLGTQKSEALTYYLTTANVGSAELPASWNTGGIGGGGSAASNFTTSLDVFVISTGQTATFNANTTFDIFVTLQVDGTVALPNANVTVTINGTVLFNSAGSAQVTTAATNPRSNVFAVSAGATLKTKNTTGISGASCSMPATGGRFTATLSTSANYEFNGTAGQATLGLPATVNDLTINNGANTVTLSAGVSVAGTLTVNATSTLSFGTTARTVALTGTGTNTLVNLGTILMNGGPNAGHILQIAATSIATFGTVTTGTGSKIQYTSTTGGQTINSSVTYNNLQQDNTSGTNTAGGNLSVGGILTTAAGGTLNMGTNTLSVTGAPANSGIISTQNTSATPIPTGKAWGGTVLYNASGNQTIVSATSYTNLQTATGGTKTLAANTTVSGVLTVGASSTLDLSSTTLTLSGSGTPLVVTGTLSTGTSTVQYTQNTTATTIAAVTYYNVSISGGATKTFAGACDISNTFSISAGNVVMNTSTTTARTFNVKDIALSGGTLDCCSSTLGGIATTFKISGSYTQSGTGIETTSGAGFGKLEFTGGGNTTYSNYITAYSASFIYNQFQVSSNTTLTLLTDFVASGVTGAGIVTVDAGSTIVCGTKLLKAGSAGGVNFTINGTLKTANTVGLSGTATTTLSSTNTPTLTLGSNSTIEYNSTVATQAITARTDYANLKINNTFANTLANAVTLGGTSTISGTLTLANGILNTNSQTLTITNTASTAVTGTFSATSHINGALIWNFPSSLGSGSTYVFPLGKAGKYLPFTLTNPTTGVTAPVVTAEAFSGSSGGSASGSLTSISTTEYWTASATGNYIGGSVSLDRSPTAIGSSNRIARSLTAAGTYNSLGGSVSGTALINSDNTGGSLGSFIYAVSGTCAAPATQPSVFTPSGTTPVQTTIGWTINTAGSKSIVLINTVNSFTPPVNGTDPSADPTYGGSGQQVVYNSNGSTVTVYGLSPSTTYYFQIYAANCSGVNIVYNLTAPLTGNVTTLTQPTFYNKANTDVSVLSNWGDQTNGTGTAPVNFTTNYQLFIVRNTAATVGSAWTVSGTGAKVIVGQAADPAVTLTLNAALTGTVDIAAASSGSNTLVINSATIPTFGTINSGSTVNYSLAGAQAVTATTYGNITFSGASGTKTVGAGTFAVTGTLNMSGANTVILNALAATRTIQIKNYTQSAGTLNPSSSGATTLNISGDFNKSAGTMAPTPNAIWYYNFNGGITQTFTSNGTINTGITTVTNNSTLVLNSAFGLVGVTGNILTVDLGSTLDAGTNQITANGTGVTVAIDGTLKTKNTAGVSGSTSTTLSSTNAPTLALSLGSTVEYNGVATQTVTGRSDYGNLTLNNSTGFTLGGAASVAGTLTLQSGIITTGANTLSVTSTTVGAVTGGSTSNYISGNLKRTLPALTGSASVYTWPVGKGGTYLPFSLTTLTTAASTAITVEAFASTPSAPDGTTVISLGTEYWLATVNSGTYTNGSVSLTRQSALGSLTLIARSSAQPGTYSSLNGTVAGTSINNSDLTGNSLGAFAFGAGCTTPTTPSSSSFSNVASTSFDVNWVNGDGSSRVVFVKQTGTGDPAPVDGTDYAPNAVFASGTQIGATGWYSVYSGTGNSVTVTGLAPSTQYRVMVVEANCSGALVKYLLSTSFNQTTTATPSITVANNAPQVVAASISTGIDDVVLHQSSLAVVTGNALLTGLSATTAGTYASGDITNLKVYYSTSNTLDVNTATLLSTFTTPGTAGLKTFPSFTSQLIAAGTTGYIYITADIAPGAALGNTINIAALTTANYTFSAGSKSGSTTAGGVQTFATYCGTLTWKGAGVSGGTGGTDFNTAANWTPSLVPAACNNIVINTTTAAAITLSADATVNSLSINNNATGAVTMGVSTGTKTLTVSGNLSVTNNNSSGTSTNSYIAVGNSPGALIVNGNATFGGLVNTNSNVYLENNTITTGTMTFKGNVNFYNEYNWHATTGRFAKLIMDGTGTQTITTNSAFTFAAIQAPVQIGGTNTPTVILSNSGTATLRITEATDGLTVMANSTLDLTTNTLNKSNAGGTFTLGAGATLKLAGTTGGQTGSNFPLNYTTATPVLNATSTVEYYGAAQTIYATPTYGNLTITTAGTKTAGAALTVAGALTINSGSTFDASTFTHTVRGNWVNDGTFTASTGTITFDGTSTISGASTNTFNNVTINATKSLTAPNANMNVGGDWLNNGTFTAGSGTVTFTAAATGKTISGTLTVNSKFNNLTFNGSGGGWTLSNADVAGNFTITNGSVIAPAALDVKGNWSNSGAYTHSSGTVTLSGTSNQTISGSTVTAFNSLTENKASGRIILAQDATVPTLTLTAGNFDVANKILTLTNAVSGSFDATKMIIADGGGEVRRNYAATGSYVFPIGDNTGTAEYSPITVNVTAGSFSSAYVSAKVTDAKHPNNPNTTDFLTRYWNIATSGITTPVYNVSATYIAGVSDVTGTEANISMGKYAGSLPWVITAGGNTNPLIATGVTNTSAAFTGISNTPPSVAITGGGVTSCSGANVNLGTNVTGDGPFTYSWTSNPAGFTSTSATPTVAPTVTTIYTVVVTDANGNTGTDNTTITISSGYTWVGTTSTAWNTNTNWLCGSVPTSGADITISNTATNLPVLPGNITIGNISIAAGKSIDIGAGNTLTINGNILGTGTITGSATSNLVLGGSGASTLNFTNGSRVLKNLTLNGTGAITLGTALRIASGASAGVLTVNSGATLNAAGNLTIGSDLNGTAQIAKSLGTINGGVTVERYIPQNANRAWRFLAAPTSGSTINAAWQEGQTNKTNNTPGYGTLITQSASNGGTGFDAVTASSSILTYNAAGDSWNDVPSTLAPINNSTPYMLYVRGDRSAQITTSIVSSSATTLRSTGTVFQGTQAAVTAGANQFTAVGNPYASPVDFTALSKSGSVDNLTFYVWDPAVGGSYGLGLYQTITFNGTSWMASPGGGSYAGTLNPYIESGQAFFIHATGGAGSVTFDENAKTSGAPQHMVFGATTTAPSMIRTTLFAGNSIAAPIADGNIAIFDAQYSNAVDGKDAVKLRNFGENFGIIRNNQKLAVERRQAIAAKDTIFFNMSTLKQQAYTLRLAAENLTGVSAYLVDSYLNTITPIDLVNGSNVTFNVTSAAASSAAGRFKVVFDVSAPLPVTFVSLNAVQKNAGVQLNWKVAAEAGIVSYEVERSLNGVNFNKQAATAASAANNGNYAWFDNAPNNGVNFYRVTALDINGKHFSTNIVKVNLGNVNGTITVAPNPIVNKTVNLSFVNKVKGDYAVRIIGVNGQVVYQKVISHTGGSAVQSFNLPLMITTGTYRLEVINPDNSKNTQQVLVNN